LIIFDRLEISIDYLDENVEFKFKISTSVYPPIRSWTSRYIGNFNKFQKI